MDLLVIESLLKMMVSIALWMAIGQTLLLAAIYFKLKALLTATRKQGNNNGDKKGNTTNSRVGN